MEMSIMNGKNKPGLSDTRGGGVVEAGAGGTRGEEQEGQGKHEEHGKYGSLLQDERCCS